MTSRLWNLRFEGTAPAASWRQQHARCIPWSFLGSAPCDDFRDIVDRRLDSADLITSHLAGLINQEICRRSSPMISHLICSSNIFLVNLVSDKIVIVDRGKPSHHRLGLDYFSRNWRRTVKSMSSCDFNMFNSVHAEQTWGSLFWVLNLSLLSVCGW